MSFHAKQSRTFPRRRNGTSEEETALQGKARAVVDRAPPELVVDVAAADDQDDRPLDRLEQPQPRERRCARALDADAVPRVCADRFCELALGDPDDALDDREHLL